jgi:2-polyprenyl-3-methyl-5-hydroxy-6-metoxy-1,4-benzoquinol methylase
VKFGDHLIQSWRMNMAARWIPAGARVLDIGCHQGEFFQRMGRRIAPSVGLDPLLQEERALGEHKLLKTAFNKTLPFAEDSFDAIVLLATIEHMHNKSDVARESFRLLRSNGRVIITAPSLLVDRILDVLAALRLVDGMSLEEHHGFHPEEIPGIFTKEGFRVAAARKFQFGLNNLFVFEKP